MPTPFQTEAWTEYAIGMVILLARVSGRTWQLGFKWQGDDYFAALSILFFTAELVMLEMIGQHGAITGLTEEVAVALTPEQAARIRIGAKCLLAGWILYTTLIWCLKACMLFFYNRLTLNLRQHALVKITGAISVAAYIATITVYLTSCRPLNRLWQTYPLPGRECSLNISNYLALVVTNVTTDLMILYIPIPILRTVQLPLRRKILFGIWLCSGVFIMVATLLRCILVLQDASQVNVSTIWSIRETFVGIIAVNLPVLKPFFSRARNAMSSTRNSAKRQYYNSSGEGNPGSYRLSEAKHSSKKRSIHALTTMDNLSQEHINPDHQHGSETKFDVEQNVRVLSSSGQKNSQGDDGIVITRSYEVLHSSKSSMGDP